MALDKMILPRRTKKKTVEPSKPTVDSIICEDTCITINFSDDTKRVFKHHYHGRLVFNKEVKV